MSYNILNLPKSTTKSGSSLTYVYLPFGTRASTPTLNTSNRYRYAGKENQKVGSVDLALLNFGARLYDPYVCSWSSVDPMAEKYPGMSPYNYCMGNPMSIVDPDGMDILFAHWVSDGDGGGYWKQGEISKTTMIAIEAFAKTNVGYAFMSQFAKEGQAIGSVKFSSNGKYSSNNIKFNEYCVENGIAGSSGLSSQDGETFTFSIQVNNNYGDVIDRIITVGHECLVHTEPILEMLMGAQANDGDKRTAFIYATRPENKKVVEMKDHEAYFNGERSNFISLIIELRPIFGVDIVYKAKRSHDIGIKSK